MKKFSTALLTFIVLGSAVIPAVAAKGNTQTSSNFSTVEGSSNSIHQIKHQSISNLALSPPHPDTVNVLTSIPSETQQPAQGPRITNPIESRIMRYSTQHELLTEIHQVRQNYQGFATQRDPIGMGTQQRLAQIIHLRARQLGLSLVSTSSTQSFSQPPQIVTPPVDGNAAPHVVVQPEPAAVTLSNTTRKLW